MGKTGQKKLLKNIGSQKPCNPIISIYYLTKNKPFQNHS